MNQSIKFLVPTIRTVAGLLLISVVLCGILTTTAQANYYGYFRLGSYGYFPDDSELDNRVTLSGKLRFGWESDTSPEWSLFSDLRIRGDLDGGGSGVERVTVWDLRMNYGTEVSRFNGSAGVCSIREVSGLGTVTGATFSVKLAGGFSLGAFGGGNTVIKEGFSDLDGTRIGGFFTWKDDHFRRAGIGFVAISGTEFDVDAENLLVFDSYLRFGTSTYFYQMGEYLLGSEADMESGLNFYYGNVRYQPMKILSFSLSYNYFRIRPYLPFSEDLLDDETIHDLLQDEQTDGDRKTSYISPRITFRLGDFWRVYVRYRLRDSDYWHTSQTHQYLAGVSCGNVFRTGVSFNGNFSTSENDDESFDSIYLSVNRDIGEKLALTVSYAQSRYIYPESIWTAVREKETQRAGVALFYTFSRHLNMHLDLERSFGSDDDDNQVILNFRYRF